MSFSQGLKIKRVCIKCKPGFKNPKALSTEVMPSDSLLYIHETLVHNNRLIFFFFTNYSSKELPPQIANTSQPCLVTLPHSPHTTRNKYWEIHYSALPPLVDGSKAGPSNSSAATLHPTSFFLTSFLIGPMVNGRPRALFTLA